MPDVVAVRVPQRVLHRGLVGVVLHGSQLVRSVRPRICGITHLARVVRRRVLRGPGPLVGARRIRLICRSIASRGASGVVSRRVRRRWGVVALVAIGPRSLRLRFGMCCFTRSRCCVAGRIHRRRRHLPWRGTGGCRLLRAWGFRRASLGGSGFGCAAFRCPRVGNSRFGAARGRLRTVRRRRGVRCHRRDPGHAHGRCSGTWIVTPRAGVDERVRLLSNGIRVRRSAVGSVVSVRRRSLDCGRIRGRTRIRLSVGLDGVRRAVSWRRVTGVPARRRCRAGIGMACTGGCVVGRRWGTSRLGRALRNGWLRIVLCRGVIRCRGLTPGRRVDIARSRRLR